ncbi:MAG: nucleotidyltransferase [Altibacter sp.]|uniref:nucleotidyltransferase n=1 Tax=Altibacter sp. TaxID=2024823 RepID=UPI000C89C896|nr:nucleotidyltransferase [Altibacter sp.]MAP53889.1 nucleotidyltransferase [Altibacter sp.]|tara:strand:- start:2996 stop:3964 length:969 start_codon:yes stop_codon:yes gene_type:complete
MATNKKEHLQNVLETHRMKHVQNLVDKFKTKRNEVKEALEAHYGSNIYYSFDSGSFKKRTAINTKFDLDVVVPFKKDSFETLEKMYDSLYDFLYEEYQDVTEEIRKQTVSIGLIFEEDEDGDKICLDIVPGRELNQDQYSEDNKLNLFVYRKYGIFSSSTHIQTNIQAQIDHIKAKENERKIIRLLKIWNNNDGKEYKSFLLELITIKAFEKEDISGNLWEKLEKVMEYIKDKVAEDGFKLIDPGNSNNDLMDTLEDWEKTNLSNRMETMLERINSNSDNIKSYFPTNKDFEDDDKSSNSSGYGIKTGGAAYSTPPKNERFG